MSYYDDNNVIGNYQPPHFAYVIINSITSRFGKCGLQRMVDIFTLNVKQMGIEQLRLGRMTWFTILGEMNRINPFSLVHPVQMTKQTAEKACSGVAKAVKLAGCKRHFLPCNPYLSSATFAMMVETLLYHKKLKLNLGLPEYLSSVQLATRRTSRQHWLHLLGEFINSRDDGGCKPQQPSPLTEIPGLDAIHVFSKSLILFIPVIKQDTSQQYMSVSYRATGKCPEGKQSKIKQEVLVTIASPLLRAGGFFAQVIASIASVELLHNQWPDLIKLLLGFVNNPTDTNLRIMMLQMIGYICKSIGEHNHIIQVAYHGPYYDKMAFYMEQALFMAVDYGELPEVESKFIAKIALPKVNPIPSLTPHSPGGSFDTVIPFIEAYIKSPNQHQWGAAMISILTATSGNAEHTWWLGEGIQPMADKLPNFHCLRRHISGSQVVGFGHLLLCHGMLSPNSILLLHLSMISDESHVSLFNASNVSLANSLNSTLSSTLWPSPPALLIPVMSFLWWYAGRHNPNHLEDEISDPEEDTLAEQMVAMRGGSVKKVPVAEEDSDDSSTDDGGEDNSSDSD
ncbi:hypothetical protein EDC04DRAFT_2999981 [Pisolithus marmoratus]|nr:hypothetical protein EDC04DRAFT_2999981 [Pisolithus marmoratus]